MALKHIDQDGIYPGGKRGLPGRAAMAIVNENSAETEERLSALESGTGGVVDDIQALQSGLTLLDGRIDSEQMARQSADDALAALVGGIPGKNVLINGNFDFAQRGVTGSRTSAAVEAMYTVDRWVCGFVNVNGNWGVGGTPLGQVPGSNRYLGYNIASIPNNQSSAYIAQKVEGVETLAGKTVTMSMWARSNVAGKKIGMRALQLFGNGGSPSAGTAVECPTLVTLSTTFQRYSFTVTLPSVVGKTKGSDGTDGVLFVLDYSGPSPLYGGALSGQTGLFEVAQAQVEEGGVATGFEFRPKALELVLCQRYYEKSYDVDTEPRTVSGLGREAQFYDRTTGGSATSQIRFKVTKRGIPAVGVFSDVTGDINRVSGNSGGAGVVTGIAGVGVNGCQVNYTSASGQWGSGFQWAADAEI